MTPLSRRRFLGQTALHLAATMGLGAIATDAAFAQQPSEDGVAAGADAAARREHWPAIVVGSGYGGAVSALRLGAAGVETLVLEMGRAWTTPDADGRTFSPTLGADRRSMWFKDRTEAPLDRFFFLDVINRDIPRFAGVLDRVHFGDMSVYAGRGLGGGSLVNGAMCVTPRRAYFEEVLPDVDAGAMFGRYFPLASTMLGANYASLPLLFDDVHKYARVSWRQATAAGFRCVRIPSSYDMGHLERELRGTARKSAIAQEVIYGNEAGKLTLDKSYLADAMGTGRVTVRTLTRVAAVRREPDGTWVLSTVEIDALGVVVARREVGCRTLVLSAGVLGTNELLLRARETGTLPDLPAAIGEGWGPNGNVMASRLTGEFTNGTQSTMPVAAIDNWDDPVDPALIEITPLPTGFENMTGNYLGVSRSPERATLSYDPATDGLGLDWRREQAGPSIRALRRVLDRINRRERTDYRNDLFAEGRIFSDHFCYHPLGGCRIGPVTDPWGGVHGHAGLFVNDGSLIPGSIGVNPYCTITALAERNAAEAIVPSTLSAG